MSASAAHTRGNRDTGLREGVTGPASFKAVSPEITMTATPLLRHGLANRRFDDSGHLHRIRDQLDVVAALLEERLRMGFLKITGTYLGARNMRRDGHHGHAVAMAIKEPINQVQIAGATASGAYGDFARQLRLRAGGKRGDFFMSDGKPTGSSRARAVTR